jgi:hypothetical protein
MGQNAKLRGDQRMGPFNLSDAKKRDRNESEKACCSAPKACRRLQEDKPDRLAGVAQAGRSLGQEAAGPYDAVGPHQEDRRRALHPGREAEEAEGLIKGSPDRFKNFWR